MSFQYVYLLESEQTVGFFTRAGHWRCSGIANVECAQEGKKTFHSFLTRGFRLSLSKPRLRDGVRGG